MAERKYLNDAWLYWDPEQMEAFPHSSTADPQASERLPGETERGAKPLQLRLLEDMLLYAAGLASAMAGIGLVILLGSFISAYSVLTESHRAVNDSISSLRGAAQHQQPPTAALEAAAREGAVFESPAEQNDQLSLLETRIDGRQGRAAQNTGP